MTSMAKLTNDAQRFFELRGIPLESVEAAGVQSEGSTIKYPRYCRHTGQRIGWKVRDLQSGRVWNEPSGVSADDVLPLMLGSRNGSGVFICEGETDTLRMFSLRRILLFEPDQWLFICAPGANGFRSWWANDWQGKYVRVVPDADPAGEQLALDVCAIRPDAKVLRLPAGKDACSATVGEISMADSCAEPLDSRTVPTPKPKRPRFVDNREDFDLRSEVSRVVDLRRRGNQWAARCPFHDEKTASFMLDEHKQAWYCHGCGRGGGVFEWRRLLEEGVIV